MEDNTEQAQAPEEPPTQARGQGEQEQSRRERPQLDPEGEDEWFHDHTAYIDDDTNGEYFATLLDEECSARGGKETCVDEAEEVAGDGDGDNEYSSDGEAVAEDEADREHAVGEMNLAEDHITPSSPCLLGMPDIVLEDIVHYACKKPSEVCELETVCRRLRRMAIGEEFWDRHPIFKKEKDRCYCLLPFFPRLDPPSTDWTFRDLSYDGFMHRMEELSDRYQTYAMGTREKALHAELLRKVKEYQWNEKGGNEILSVLGVEDFRSLAADIMSRMIPCAEGQGELSIRLRGDTVGYLAEVLQGHILNKMNSALLVTINNGRYEVRKRDLELCTRRNWRFQTLELQPRPFHCDVSTNDHGVQSLLGCSCSLPSTSNRIWRWPDGNCHYALPMDAGRRIIRRLAFKAGIVKMTHEAFALAEAELLHTMGLLLVDAYEASVIASKTTQSIGPDEMISYCHPGGAVDMFWVSPPPVLVNYVKKASENESCDDMDRLEVMGYEPWDLFNAQTDRWESSEWVKNELMYTIVPGQIRAAAEKREISPFIVHGDTWVATTGFEVDDEKDIEESYYCRSMTKQYEPHYSCQGESDEGKNDSDDEMILVLEDVISIESSDESVSNASEMDLSCSSEEYSEEESVESEEEEWEEDFWDCDDHSY